MGRPCSKAGLDHTGYFSLCILKCGAEVLVYLGRFCSSTNWLLRHMDAEAPLHITVSAPTPGSFFFSKTKGISKHRPPSIHPPTMDKKTHDSSEIRQAWKLHRSDDESSLI